MYQQPYHAYPPQYYAYPPQPQSRKFHNYLVFSTIAGVFALGIIGFIALMMLVFLDAPGSEVMVGPIFLVAALSLLGIVFCLTGMWVAARTKHPRIAIAFSLLPNLIGIAPPALIFAANVFSLLFAFIFHR